MSAARVARRLSLALAGVLLLLAPPALAARLIAVLPLDVTNTSGKMDRAAQVSLEEALRNVATEVLRPSGWTILSGENMLQVLVDNDVDPAKCGEENCQLQAAREIKVDKFISGSVQFVDGEFTASIRLIDTRSGQILSSVSLTGQTTRELREKFEAKSAEFFSRAAIVGGATVQEETTGELFLQADPPDATFQLDNGPRTELIPGRNTVLTLPLGAHHLVLSKQGLQDYRQDVFIERGKPVTVRVTLLAPPPPADAGGQAYLSVDSTPQQARIFLDGRDTGKLTPANFAGLSAGVHQLVLQRDLFLDWQQRIVLKADDVKLVKPELRSNFGTLSITTEPAGATVYVDGRQQPGITPFRRDHFEAKAYRVRLTLPQYDTVEKTVVIQSGETTSLTETLKPQFGTLVLHPKPDGATVYLDDVQLPEQTPMTRERLGARMYKLRLTYPLYRDLEKTIRIEAGKTTVIEDALIPTTGGLIVTAEVNGEAFAGAEVYLDGEKKGVTPFSLATVPEGELNVEVRAPLHRSFSTKTVVVSQQQVTLNAKLIPEYGFVRASASQPGTLTVDGAPVGAADGQTYKIAMGAHRLGVTPEDPARYRPFEQEAVVEVGRTVELNATLTPRVGNLVVQTAPPGASITLDGERRGESPLKLDSLFAGRHALRLELEKYVDATQDVEVEEGKTQVVDITLKSVDLVKYEAELRNVKLNRAIAAGSVAGAFGVASGVSLFLAHNYARTENSALASYNAATKQAAIEAYRLNATSAHNSARTSQIVSVATGVAALGAVAWTIYELVTLPRAATPIEAESALPAPAPPPEAEPAPAP